MELSHRSPEFEQILRDAENSLRNLLAIPATYHVLMMQGGASHLFSLLPMAYAHLDWSVIVNGSWGEKALEACRAVRPAEAITVPDDPSFTRAYTPELVQNAPGEIVHLTTNETIQGVQGGLDLPSKAHLVADMSSDILTRPVPWESISLAYAGAQKNLGPAGVTVCIIREDFLAEARTDLPPAFNFRTLVKNGSLYNTPPTWSIYVMGECLKYWQSVGGLPEIIRRNEIKANQLYRAIDQSNGFFQGHAHADFRSPVNVTYRLPDRETESDFLAKATERGMVGLAGHRAVGGIRASIYNAFPVEGVDALTKLISEFTQ